MSLKSDVPGPGYYETAPAPYVHNGVSVSKKGFTNAFVSRQYRLKSVIRNDLKLGPGDYDYNPYNRSADMRKDRLAFLQKDEGRRIPFPDPLPHPGVGEYKVHIEPGEFDRTKRLKSASFASRSTRDSYLIGPE